MIIIENEKIKLELTKKYNIKKIISNEIFEKSELCLYKKDEYLFKEDEQICFLYFFLKGKIRVLHTVENGKQALIRFYNEFTILGEIENIFNCSAYSSVQVLEEAYFLRVSKENTSLLKEYVPFLQFINFHLASKLSIANNNSIINMNYSVEQRLASYILFMEKDLIFKENYTHLSQYLGCSHRQLLRVFHHFCDKGILNKDKQNYYILEKETLQTIAGDTYL